ncbi:prolipoprotein diacylglyceryl transferase [Arthrobacter sp. Hiyo8]|nr:prolipoprotein diacylglyceryl transferase [Arthrobacter sp. Hiyo8]
MTASDSFLPSPTVSAFHAGPVTIHFYALCILAGIVVAVWLASRRWSARGGAPGQVLDICLWAVPAGIIGAGSTTSSPTPSSTSFRGRIRGMPSPSGTGAWGSGAQWPWGSGAWIGCRRAKVSLVAFLDAVAPGVVLPRPWAGGATGSTTSSTGIRRLCRGNSRSIRWTLPQGRR